MRGVSDSQNDLIALAAKQCPLPDLPPGTDVDGFIVVRKLHEGLLGTTWLVKEGDDDRVLELLREDYVQEIDPDKLLARAERMRQALPAELLIPIEAGEYEEHPYLVTERPEGRPLREMIDAAGKGMPGQQVKDLFIPLLDILRQTHALVRHSGLDAHNIFIGDRGELQIGQLVTYSIAEDDIFGGEEGLPRDGAIYLAPELEQYSGRAPGPADVYSMGVLLYECLCGEPPVGRYELPSAFRNDIPVELDDVIELALAGNMSERFQSADDLAMAIENAFASGGRKQDQAKLALPLIAGLVVLLAIAAGAVYMFQPEAQEDLLAAELARRATVRAEVAAQATASDPPGAAPADGMVWIPPGPFIAGRFAAQDPLAGASEREEQVITVAGFWIDVAPMQVPDGDTGDYKIVNGMTHDEADRICAKFGKRLCTADEWEKACKGPDSSIYTYGDTFDAERCPGPGFSSRYRLADFPECTGGYGVLGMSGGVGEWTSSQDGDRWVIKPAKAGSGATYSRCAGQASLDEGIVDGNIGMRCCG